MIESVVVTGFSLLLACAAARGEERRRARAAAINIAMGMGMWLLNLLLGLLSLFDGANQAGQRYFWFATGYATALVVSGAMMGLYRTSPTSTRAEKR